MKIEFKKLPNNDMTYMGITSDMVESIIIDDIPVGVVYLSEGSETGTAYIEWIEFISVFRSKHFLKPVMEHLSQKYGVLIFESDNDLVKKYKAIGAINNGYDEEREMHLWEYAVKSCTEI